MFEESMIKAPKLNYRGSATWPISEVAKLSTHDCFGQSYAFPNLKELTRCC